MKTLIALSAIGFLGFHFVMSSISGFMADAKHEIDQKQAQVISQR